MVSSQTSLPSQTGPIARMSDGPFLVGARDREVEHAHAKVEAVRMA